MKNDEWNAGDSMRVHKARRAVVALLLLAAIVGTLYVVS